MNASLIFRDLNAALERRDAATRPTSFDAERLSVEAIVATSTPVARRDERGEFDEVLDVTGADLSALRGASVLDGHRQDGVASVIGTVEECRIESDQIIARLRFSSRPELAGVVADIRDGILSNLSIGYSVSEWGDGEANGRRQRIARKWKPVEVVAVPADHRARTRQSDSELATRNRSIRELGNRVGLSRDVIDAMIDSGQPIEQVRQQVLDHLTTRGSVTIRTAHNVASLDNPATFQRAAGEALYSRVNRSHQPSGEARQFANLSMGELARECLRRVGDNLVTAAPAEAITRALNTTSDFPMILAETTGRVLRDAYRAAPSGLRQLGRVVTAPDFRERNPLVLNSSGFTLEKVGEHSEFKSGSFVESGAKYRLGTYGKIFGLWRQAIINDDLGALSDVPAKLGAQAAAFEASYLAELLEGAAGVGPTMSDTKALFHSDHANLASEGGAPGDTTLAPARLAMRQQTGPAGELIDIVPRFLVAPAALETDCEKLLTAITPIQTSDVNPWSRLGLIVEPRLTSATAWYLSADAPASGLEICYLSGAEGPQTETRAGFEIDGVQTKVRLDFEAAFVDWRGMYLNEGAQGGQ